MATYEVAVVRNIAGGKLSYFLEFWNETWWKWSFGINAGTQDSFVTFPQQGAELFCVKGGKRRVLSILRGFDLPKGPKRGQGLQRVGEGPLGSGWSRPLAICPPQVYAGRAI